MTSSSRIAVSETGVAETSGLCCGPDVIKPVWPESPWRGVPACNLQSRQRMEKRRSPCGGDIEGPHGESIRPWKAKIRGGGAGSYESVRQKSVSERLPVIRQDWRAMPDKVPSNLYEDGRMEAVALGGLRGTRCSTVCTLDISILCLCLAGSCVAVCRD